MYIEAAAHRGNVAEYPKNTMLAYKSAYEIGADMIEPKKSRTESKGVII